VSQLNADGDEEPFREKLARIAQQQPKEDEPGKPPREQQ
jgi:hypothetical protein